AFRKAFAAATGDIKKTIIGDFRSTSAKVRVTHTDVLLKAVEAVN
ncbi:hypothetical protein JTE90_024122, partial [Oedothorax gibbosus]